MVKRHRRVVHHPNDDTPRLSGAQTFLPTREITLGVEQVKPFKNVVRGFRLWNARMFGPPVGIWDVDRPIYINQTLHAWRVREDGDYEYRPLTPEEATRYVHHILTWAGH